MLFLCSLDKVDLATKETGNDAAKGRLSSTNRYRHLVEAQRSRILKMTSNASYSSEANYSGELSKKKQAFLIFETYALALTHLRSSELPR